MQKITLFDEHKKLGAKFTNFAGFKMPLKYNGELIEYAAVRENVGVFDVSHMGEIRIQGPDALKFCDYMTPNLVSKLTPGHIHYSVIMNASGGVVDDVTLYMRSENDYFFCVNAANKDKALAHLHRYLDDFDVVVTDESSEWDLLAIQGPTSNELLEPVAKKLPQKRFTFIETTMFNTTVLISRTGYTGESGVEIYIPKKHTIQFWKELMTHGESFNLMPCGLGVRDVLRLEMGYILYGHELNDSTSPVEAGISWIVKKDSGYLGSDIVNAHKNGDMKTTLVGIKMLEKAIPRANYLVFSEIDGTFMEIGKIVSGTHSPRLSQGIGTAFIKPHVLVTEKKNIHIEIRNQYKRAEICTMPFFKV